LEYKEGISLHGLLKERDYQLPDNLKIHLIKSLLVLANDTQAIRVVYRDWSVKNVYVGAEGNVYLIDFGLSLDLSKQSQGRETADGLQHQGFNAGTGIYNSYKDVESLLTDAYREMNPGLNVQNPVVFNQKDDMFRLGKLLLQIVDYRLTEQYLCDDIFEVVRETLAMQVTESEPDKQLDFDKFMLDLTRLIILKGK
jgi:serine/threonine protein kinase